MQTKFTVEPTGRRRPVPAELLSVIRGGHLLVADAHPPAAPRASTSPASHTKER